MSRSPRALALLLVPLLTASVLALGPAGAASAEGLPGAPPDGNPPSPSTEATIIDMVDTSGLYGGTVPSATAQTPYPTTGLVDQRSVETALIVLDDRGTPQPEDDVLAYCIDLDTRTTIGVHYELGTWTEANVPNLPYVQWILDHYYPTVPTAPAGTAAEQVRAVQGAIWYFTDQFVVSRFYPAERSAVRAIVEAAQAAVGSPTPPAPPLPTLAIAPPSITGTADGALVGPYLVEGDVPAATIEITATQVYRDPAGTDQLADGDAVAPGDELWARYDAQLADQGFALTATAIVPAGNVYLYNGGNPPLQAAQKLVLAAETEVPVRAAASIVHPEVATLRVDVVVDGAAAGRQGPIQVTATCETDLVSAPLVYVRRLPAGAAAGTYSFEIAGIPDDDTSCSVVQDADGATATVQVATTIAPPAVVLSGAAPQTITVADVFTLVPGDFRVDLTIAGPAAGSQGEIVLLASCDTGGATVSDSFDVAAGATGTLTAGVLTGLPNGSACSASVTATGDDADAELVASTVVPAFATVPAGGVAQTTVTNSYAVPSPATGRLAVDVAVDGPAAGRQDAISVLASCDSGASAPFTLPAGAPAGTYRVGTVADLPVGAACTVAQTADGADGDAALAGTTIVPASVVIADDALATITVTDSYAVPGPPSGSFRVAVTIGGPAAGAQSTIDVTARCGAAPEELVASFSLPAGLAAGTHTAGTIAEVPVGDACTAVLAADGADADAVLAGSSVTPASVLIADGVESTVTVALDYAAPAPGPTPTPSPDPSPMPVTGGAGEPPWGAAIALLLAGAAITGLAATLRRRFG